MIQHTVKEIRFEAVGEYIHCIAVGTDDTYLAIAEASARRDAAWGIRKELQTRTNLTTSDDLMQLLNRECKRR